MKIIRGVLFFIASIAFVVSLFLANTFFVVSSSLNYETISPNLSYSINEVLEDSYNFSSYLEENYGSISEYCLPHSYYYYNYSILSFNVSCSDVFLGENETLSAIKNQNIYLSDSVIENIQSNISLHYQYILDYCSSKEVYVSNISGINVSCNSVSEGIDSVKYEIVDTFARDIYYKNYSCAYWNCFSKTGSTFFLVSKMSSDYWKSKFYFFFLASLGIFVLIFFLLESKLDILSFLGISFIVSSLPLLKLESFLFWIIKPFISGLDYINYLDASTVMSAFSVFFSKSGAVFKFNIALGIILLVFWIGIKIWLFATGRNKKMFSKKDVEKIVNEEIKKSKNSEKTSKVNKTKPF